MATIDQALNILRNACGNFAVDMKADDAYFCKAVITIRVPYGISFNEEIEETKSYKIPEVREIRYNGPATIVKMQPGEEYYDPDKAFAMAVCKKLFGNKFNRHLTEAQKAFDKCYEEECEKECIRFDNLITIVRNMFSPSENSDSEDKKGN